MHALTLLLGLLTSFAITPDGLDESDRMSRGIESFVCPLDAGPDTSTCGFRYILTGSETTGSWSVICSESREEVWFDNPLTDTTLVTVTRCGTYRFVYSVPTGPCSGTDTVDIIFLDPSTLRTHTEVDVEFIWDTECHQSPNGPICDNTVDITGLDPPELLWEICRLDSCRSINFFNSPDQFLDSCLIDTVLMDTVINADNNFGCEVFLPTDADDFPSLVDSLAPTLSCLFPDTCYTYDDECIDTIPFVDTLLLPILDGGLWNFVNAGGQLVPLMDSSFLQIGGRDYLLILEPGADHYGPEDLMVTIWEIIGGSIQELTVPVTIDLQWVPEVVYDTLFLPDTIFRIKDSCRLVPCGGIIPSGGITIGEVPDFPCGPISVTFDVEMDDMFYVLELNCNNPEETIEVCTNEFVTFDTPGSYGFDCFEGCPSFTNVDVIGNFAQPTITWTTICAPDQQSYQVSFEVTGGTGPIEVLGAGAFNYDQTITITGINSCEDFFINVIDPISQCEAFVIVNRCCCNISESNIASDICEGEVYDFFGMPLTQSGTYETTLTSQDGCDSIINLDLTVHPPGIDSRNISICDGEVLNFYGQQLTTAGSFEAYPIGPNGCDSVVTLTLAVDPLQSDTRQRSVCEGEALDFYGDMLTDPGTYEVQFANAAGCDSVIELILSLQNGASVEIESSICIGETYNFNGNILTDAGTYADTLTTSSGCDSAILLTLTYSDPVFGLTSTPSCFMQESGSIIIDNVSGGVDPYVYSINGVDYQDSPEFDGVGPGEYDVYMVDDFGCSTVESITVDEIPGITADVLDSYLICGGDPIVIDVTQPSAAVDTVIYEWSDGTDGSSFTIAANGSYWVEISNSCESQRYEFNVASEDESPASKIYVPNVFTPNEDGINDYFKAFASAPVINFEMHLYDRWGEELLIMYDIEEFWDGGFLGQSMQPGVYVWWLKAELENCAGEMSEVLMKGDVTLIR